MKKLIGIGILLLLGGCNAIPPAQPPGMGGVEGKSIPEVKYDRFFRPYDRISTNGKQLDYSKAALKQALAPIHVEEMDFTMDDTDADVLFRKDQSDKSTFPVEVDDHGKKLHGRIAVVGKTTTRFLKKSLMIKFEDGDRWNGKKRISFRSMASDPSMMRDWIAFGLLKAMGSVMPNTHFVRIKLNGKPIGLYIYVEWMDKQFVEEKGLGSGELYNTEDSIYCGNMYPDSFDRMDKCWNKLTPDDGNFDAITKLAKTIYNAKAEDFDKVLAEHFDVDSVLNWIALNALISNGDVYNKNYFLYHKLPSDKWVVIPWDFDLTYGRNWDPNLAPPYSTYNDNFQYYYPVDTGAPSPIKEKVIRNEKLKKRLYDRIKHMIGEEMHGPKETFGWFSPTVMTARVRNLAKVIGPELDDETLRKPMPKLEYHKSQEAIEHFALARANALKFKMDGAAPWPPQEPNAPMFAYPLPEMSWGEGDFNEKTVYTEHEARSDGGPTVFYRTEEKKLVNDYDSFLLGDPGLGHFTAQLTFHQVPTVPVRIKSLIDSDQPPKYVPEGMVPEQCIQRTWMVYAVNGGVDVHADLTLEYLQETSTRNEYGSKLDRKNMVLWARDEHTGAWRQLPTYRNNYDKTLTTPNMHFVSGSPTRFVACSVSK